MTYNIAVLIPVFNRKETTLNCIRHLKQVDFCRQQVDIVIIDDGSTDGTAEAVTNEFDDVTILKGDGNLWWSGAMNKGLEYALAGSYDYVFFLNDDVDFKNDFFIPLLDIMKKKPDALISSIKVYSKSGTIKILTSGFKVHGFLHEINNHLADVEYDVEKIPEYVECDALTGASLLIPLKVVGMIGLLDVVKFPHNWGDIEYTRRAAACGIKCIVATRSVVSTEYNQNYHFQYLLHASRSEYFRNLFDNYRFNYGFKRIWIRSLMHKPVHKGLLLFSRRLLGTIKWIVFKLFLPKSILSSVIRNHPGFTGI